VIIAAVVLSVAMCAEYRKATGLELGGLGPASWALVLATVLIVLGLFSTALALASLDVHGWIAVPPIVAFAVGAVATVLFTALARRRLRRVRSSPVRRTRPRAAPTADLRVAAKCEAR
jgi:membrane protein implicated in regulation of membrane protease activity